jgi:hypothetical protein
VGKVCSLEASGFGVWFAVYKLMKAFYKLKILLIFKMEKAATGMVDRACNPSYSGGRGRKITIQSSRPYLKTN